MRPLPIPFYKLILLIIFYPWFLKLFYLGNVGEISSIFSYIGLILAFTTPLYSLYLSISIRQKPALDDTEKAQRNFALLGVIIPSLFTLIGVVLYMIGLGMTAELVVYYTFWLIAALVLLKPSSTSISPSKPIPAGLRVAHGISALVLLVFITAHLINHLSANWGGETHIQLMENLRHYYRHPIVEIFLIGVFIFQMASGFVLLSRHAAEFSDGYRTTQLATGLLVMVFLASHVTAVLGLGRGVLSLDTNWDWLVYAPGLMKDPWNVRLVVHYSLGVLALLVHVLLGLRVVISAHKGIPIANKAFWSILIIPFVAMFLIMRPLLLA
ncbi:hypothetical protein L1D15_02105 [Vibrio sp. Isolate25]|uniref:hypothetical protein n=1 Tax=Vibrio sp. Isolate25 TaxID=2908535 RepID=UPI001EFDD828|nr:hypothetical protein [Vibrio sp. Isolate25]MCG9595509.1 hypothetical protein [Vibrio sp. Isolate25]